jgi:hypothetical protein
VVTSKPWQSGGVPKEIIPKRQENKPLNSLP